MSAIACLRQSALVGVNCPHETRILTSPSAVLCAAQAVFGCSLTPMELRQVSSDLTIVVTHRGKCITDRNKNRVFVPECRTATERPVSRLRMLVLQRRFRSNRDRSCVLASGERKTISVELEHQ